MNLKFLTILLSLLIVTSSFSDSLWNPDFKGYLSSGKTLKQGDIIHVSISSKTSLSFLSASNDNKFLTMEFTGGDYGDLLSFLPTIKNSGNNKLKGNEEIKLVSDIVTTVISIDENFNAYLEGSRSIEIDGKIETLTLTGTVAANGIGANKRIEFSRMANVRLVYKTFITPKENTLSEEDIISSLQNLNAVTEGIAAPAPDAALLPSTIPLSLPTTETFSLSEKKKKELLLQYINKLIDLIFH